MPLDPQSLRVPDAALRDIQRISSRVSVLEPMLGVFPKLAEVPDYPSGVQLIAEATGLDSGETHDLLRGISSVLVFRESTGEPPEAALQTLTATLEQHAPDPWKSVHLENWRRAEPYVAKLIDPDGPLAILHKSTQVLYAHERVYLRANIFTDVRPVFDSSGTRVLRAGLAHMLSLVYRRADKEDEVHIALDDADLRELEELVARSRSKAEALRAQLTWPISGGVRGDDESR